MSAANDRRSVTLHQQAGLSVQEFADREGLTLKEAQYCIRHRKVLGARKDARSKKWTIYPPAKLLSRPQRRAERGEALKAPAASPDLLAGVDAVAVEARTRSRQSGQASPPVEAEGMRPPADGVPEAFTSAQVRESCRCLEAAAARVPRTFALELSEPLLLWAWGAAHRDLGKLLDDAKKGRCAEADTRLARALYGELSKLVYSRLPNRKQPSNGGIEAAFWLTDSEREEVMREIAP